MYSEHNYYNFISNPKDLKGRVQEKLDSIEQEVLEGLKKSDIVEGIADLDSIEQGVMKRVRNAYFKKNKMSPPWQQEWLALRRLYWTKDGELSLEPDLEKHLPKLTETPDLPEKVKDALEKTHKIILHIIDLKAEVEKRLMLQDVKIPEIFSPQPKKKKPAPAAKDVLMHTNMTEPLPQFIKTLNISQKIIELEKIQKIIISIEAFGNIVKGNFDFITKEVGAWDHEPYTREILSPPWKQECARALRLCKEYGEYGDTPTNALMYPGLARQLPKLIEITDLPEKVKNELQEMQKILKESEEARGKIKIEGKKLDSRIIEEIQGNDALNANAICRTSQYTASTCARMILEISGREKLFSVDNPQKKKAKHKDDKDKAIELNPDDEEVWDKAIELNPFQCLNVPEKAEGLISLIKSQHPNRSEYFASEVDLFRVSTILHYHACCKPKNGIDKITQRLVLHPDPNCDLEEEDPLPTYFPEYTGTISESGIWRGSLKLLGNQLNATKSLGVIIKEFVDTYQEMVLELGEESAQMIISKVLYRKPGAEINSKHSGGLFNSVYVTSEVLPSDYAPLISLLVTIALKTMEYCNVAFPNASDESNRNNFDKVSYFEFLKYVADAQEILRTSFFNQRKDRDVLIKEYSQGMRAAGICKSIESLPVDEYLKIRDKRRDEDGIKKQQTRNARNNNIIDLLSCSTSKFYIVRGTGVMAQSLAGSRVLSFPEELEVLIKARARNKDFLVEYVGMLKGLKISPDDLASALMRMMNEKRSSPQETEGGELYDSMVAFYKQIGAKDMEEAYRYFYLLSLNHKYYDPKLIAKNLEKFRAAIGYAPIKEIIKFISPLAEELGIKIINKIGQDEFEGPSIEELDEKDENMTPSSEEPLTWEEQAQKAELVYGLLCHFIEHAGYEMSILNAEYAARGVNIEQVLENRIRETSGLTPKMELSEDTKQIIKDYGDIYRKSCKEIEAKFLFEGLDSKRVVRLLADHLFNLILVEIKCSTQETADNTREIADNNFWSEYSKLGVEEIDELFDGIIKNIGNPSSKGLMRMFCERATQNFSRFFAFGSLQEQKLFSKLQLEFRHNGFLHSEKNISPESIPITLDKQEMEIMHKACQDIGRQAQFPGINYRSLRVHGASKLLTALKEVMVEGKYPDQFTINHFTINFYDDLRRSLKPIKKIFTDAFQKLAIEEAKTLKYIKLSIIEAYESCDRKVKGAKNVEEEEEATESRNKSVREKEKKYKERSNEYEEKKSQLRDQHQDKELHEILQRLQSSESIDPKTLALILNTLEEKHLEQHPAEVAQSIEGGADSSQPDALETSTRREIEFTDQAEEGELTNLSPKRKSYEDDKQSENDSSPSEPKKLRGILKVGDPQSKKILDQEDDLEVKFSHLEEPIRLTTEELINPFHDPTGEIGEDQFAINESHAHLARDSDHQEEKMEEDELSIDNLPREPIEYSDHQEEIILIKKMKKVQEDKRTSHLDHPKRQRKVKFSHVKLKGAEIDEDEDEQITDPNYRLNRYILRAQKRERVLKLLDSALQSYASKPEALEHTLNSLKSAFADASNPDGLYINYGYEIRPNQRGQARSLLEEVLEGYSSELNPEERARGILKAFDKAASSKPETQKRALKLLEDVLRGHPPAPAQRKRALISLKEIFAGYSSEPSRDEKLTLRLLQAALERYSLAPHKLDEDKELLEEAFADYSTELNKQQRVKKVLEALQVLKDLELLKASRKPGAWEERAAHARKEAAMEAKALTLLKNALIGCSHERLTRALELLENSIYSLDPSQQEETWMLLKALITGYLPSPSSPIKKRAVELFKCLPITSSLKPNEQERAVELLEAAIEGPLDPSQQNETLSLLGVTPRSSTEGTAVDSMEDRERGLADLQLEDLLITSSLKPNEQERAVELLEAAIEGPPDPSQQNENSSFLGDTLSEDAEEVLQPEPESMIITTHSHDKPFGKRRRD